MKIETNFSGHIKSLAPQIYHACEALGSSQIIEARISAAHFKAHLREPKRESSAFDLGTCAHELILEGTTERFIRGPECSTKASSIFKKASTDNPDHIVLLPQEHDKILAMNEAFTNHFLAFDIVKAAAKEESFFIVDPQTSLWLKCRPDGYYSLSDGSVVIFDYKTAQAATPREFSMDLNRYGYDLKAAHYKRTFEIGTGLAVSGFLWIVQEKTTPYGIKIYRASEACLKRATDIYISLLGQIAVGQSTGVWPSYKEEIEEIDIPSWAQYELANKQSLFD